MDTNILQFIDDNRQELIVKWLEEIMPFREEEQMYKISNESYVATHRKFIYLLLESVSKDEQDRNEMLTKFSKEQIKLGWPLRYLTKGLQSFKQVLLQHIIKDEEKKLHSFDTYNEVEEWIDSTIDQLVGEYTGSWESRDTMQKLALRELSAPLIPVFDGISVMPLIGTIDTERARLVMENLLNGVIKYESEVVLIDITGVPVVDTMVAQHLIQASEAIRLVGANCILVGIRPEIAQTIVNLGINLSQFPTTSSLRKGIELALSMTNREIKELEVGDING